MESAHYTNPVERAADAWVHFIGVALALAGGPTLVAIAYDRHGAGPALAIFAYALCLLIMLAVSAAYNLAANGARQRQLRRFDHAAIFLMIAGSYTPFTTQSLEGVWATGMTIAIWSLALLAAAGKLLAPDISKRAWVLVYVLLGWLVIVAIGPLATALPAMAFILLVAGGVIYTLGALIYTAQKTPFRRAIWHGFVLAAASAHYAAILIGVVLLERTNV